MLNMEKLNPFKKRLERQEKIRYQKAVERLNDVLQQAPYGLVNIEKNEKRDNGGRRWLKIESNKGYHGATVLHAINNDVSSETSVSDSYLSLDSSRALLTIKPGGIVDIETGFVRRHNDIVRNMQPDFLAGSEMDTFKPETDPVTSLSAKAKAIEVVISWIQEK